jgi:predicted AAA+ superfamily ATPase
MNFTRAIASKISEDLKERMVLIGGPRQVGKTTLARQFLTRDEQYFSWDDLEQRAILKKHQIDQSLNTVVLDEIHKYARWRTLLKGLYDKNKGKLRIIVTGSARLDHFRKGGDSLFGRYFYFRLHPFSLGEVDRQYKAETLSKLEVFGGFPEPYLKAEDVFLRRWQRERRSKVVNQDLSDLAAIKEISLVELLADMLPSKVGSPLSIKSIQEDLEVSPNTVSAWIQLLEQVYYCYRIVPFGAPKVRAVKKANKLYLWDWSEIEDVAARRENLLASHLLKFCHWKEDVEGHKMELRYLRDVVGHEIDFVVLKNKKPIFAVEAKSGDTSVSKSIKYFRERTNIPIFYQVHFSSQEYAEPKVQVMTFRNFCRRVLEGV